MSRSYKKVAGYCDSNSYMKRYANRRFRRTTLDYPNGKLYRRHTNPYDICDYKFLSFTINQIWFFGTKTDYEEKKKEYSKQKRK